MAEHILGISAFYHDSAACLISDGAIIAAAEEERFSRKKGDARFPREAIAYCLRAGGIGAGDLSAVAYYDKPITTFSRLLQSYLEFPHKSFRSFRRSIPIWVNEKLKIPKIIDEQIPGFAGEIYFCKHHESHAASAFFCSPFEDAAIVIVDGVGEWACTSLGRGSGNRIEMLREAHFPHSLGLFYSAMTQYLGFTVDLDEYKVMGLAPYGEPRYLNKLLDEVVDLKADGSLALNLKYFDYVHGLSMINDDLGRLFGEPARNPESRLRQFHLDFAASVQALTTEAMLRLSRTVKSLTGSRHLCLAGGVALNCVANGAIYREGNFDDIYVQPAAGDAGGAIGAAVQVWHQLLRHPRVRPLTDTMNGACLGPDIDDRQVETYLAEIGAFYTKYDRDGLAPQIARWLAAGHIVGLCQGRMEFGPRALGARSILGDPRDPRNQTRINLKIKYRESFRPFAPAILEERVHEYFAIDIPSPYMLMVMPVIEGKQLGREMDATVAGLDKLRVVRSDVPAVTHVDYSVRLQTVTRQRNGFFYDVVKSFHELTGCPMIVNTSFNLRGEPIICDHHDAYHCFVMSDIDILVVGNCVVTKPGVELGITERATTTDSAGTAYA
jgi:carbamoyltransferase